MLSQWLARPQRAGEGHCPLPSLLPSPLLSPLPSPEAQRCPRGMALSPTPSSPPALSPPAALFTAWMGPPSAATHQKAAPTARLRLPMPRLSLCTGHLLACRCPLLTAATKTRLHLPLQWSKEGSQALHTAAPTMLMAELASSQNPKLGHSHRSMWWGCTPCQGAPAACTGQWLQIHHPALASGEEPSTPT